MTKLFWTIILTLTSLFFATGQTEKYEKRYYQPTKETKQNAKKAATDWLEKYSDKIGIPTIELGELVFGPNESTFETVQVLYEKNATPSKNKISEALKIAETNEMYRYKNDFINKKTSLNQTIYFSFDTFEKLLWVNIYEADGIHRTSYTIDGQTK